MRLKTSGLFLLVFVIVGCSKKQEVIFDAESIRYKNKDSWATSEITKECNAISKELKTFLADGWKVVTSSPKEKLVYNNTGTCVGTEYVLEK